MYQLIKQDLKAASEVKSKQEVKAARGAQHGSCDSFLM